MSVKKSLDQCQRPGHASLESVAGYVWAIMTPDNRVCGLYVSRRYAFAEKASLVDAGKISSESFVEAMRVYSPVNG